ncbi:PAS domain S-box protein [Sulfurimonas aquatica]|uniref:PAS domain S-box protein n=1 Tax=Sulfurimonas aquatica TaxID=2672570 RepID=A0A975GD67_9BACT|nr:HD domain-containing phosphohydrolase [Sulfurimonas aquatica]QSZ42038.1 PAS domain S-box protein [Sulfurimonas aquatica]
MSIDNLKDFTILYVEDNRDISEEVAYMLQRYVKKLYVAYDGKEGLEAFLKNKPDIIITDIQMPIMNGLDMIEIIRKTNTEVPIIVTTAFNESDYLLKAIELHVDAYQVKPIKMKMLIKSLNKVIEPIVLREQVKQKNEQISENNHYLEQFKNIVYEASIFSSSDKNGIITDINKNYELISGYTREEMIGNPHTIHMDDSVEAEIYQDLRDTIQSGKIWSGMIKNKSKSGKPYYVITEIGPIYNRDGSFKEYIGIRNDVSELEEYKLLLKNELAKTSNNLEETINYTNQYENAINTKTAILKTDTMNIITYANDSFCELSGYKREEILGHNCLEMRHKKHQETLNCELRREQLSKKKLVEEILTNIKKNGDEYIVDNLFYPIVNLEGEVVEHLQIMYDITELMQLNQEIIDTQKEVVLTMGAIGETRSKETGLHVKRVAEYSYLLARLSGLSEKEASLLKQASPMHDIGKVGIPDNILNKPGKLTDEEFEIMKTHAEIGYEMLKYSKRAILKASATVAYTHHEKYNGTGYPNKTIGKDIHIYGRITAIADVFDALGHDRVYKKAWPLEDILELFTKERGKHFDPDLIDLFFENLEKFLSIKERMNENISLATID